MRLTTPEADFTLQTADDCQPVRLPNTKRSRPRKARDQDGKSTSCARVHSRLPPHPRAASRSGPRLHLHSTPASDALPGGPVGSQGLALFSSLCSPPPSLSPSAAAQTSGNYSRSWVQAGSGRKTAATPRAGGVAEARVPPQGPRAATAVRIRETGSGGRGKSGSDGPYLP